MATTDPKLLGGNSVSISGTLVEGAKQRILHVQAYTELSVRSLANLFSPPYYMSDVLDQMDIIGVGSLPIVLLTGFFIGAVMVLQTAAQFERFGQTALTADVVSLALVRELGPSITGLLVAGRNSSGMASELGSMVVSEQVDAMRAMGTDPTRKLVTPRVVATVLMLPLLTAMADWPIRWPASNTEERFRRVNRNTLTSREAVVRTSSFREMTTNSGYRSPTARAASPIQWPASNTGGRFWRVKRSTPTSPEMAVRT